MLIHDDRRGSAHLPREQRPLWSSLPIRLSTSAPISASVTASDLSTSIERLEPRDVSALLWPLGLLGHLWKSND